MLGTDLSGQMVEVARQRAAEQQLTNVKFLRMDAETLDLPNATFDVVLCALGLMYLPDPQRAVREWLRVLKPGGRVVIAIWGKRVNCGWSPVFPIVDAEVESDVCPLFFSLGEPDALARLCSDVGFENVQQRRIATMLKYADADEACDAAFVGGPVALAWSRFDARGARPCASPLQACDRTVAPQPGLPDPRRVRHRRRHRAGRFYRLLVRFKMKCDRRTVAACVFQGHEAPAHGRHECPLVQVLVRRVRNLGIDDAPAYVDRELDKYRSRRARARLPAARQAHPAGPQPAVIATSSSAWGHFLLCLARTRAAFSLARAFAIRPISGYGMGSASGNCKLPFGPA